MDTYLNKYLFSEAYIDDKIIDLKNENKVDDKTSRIFYSIKEWLEPFTEGDMDEEYWIEDFIDIILNTVLGFNSLDNNNIRILKEDDLAEKSAVAYVLDKDKDIDSKIKGKFYAYEAVKKAKYEGLNWAILTNGYKWRLYNTNNISPYENYLEIDIEESLNKESPDISFKLFIYFFKKNNFIYDNDTNNLKLDKMLKKSNERVDEIEEHLKEKAELILNDLCNGFKENMKFDLYTESDRREIYVDSIIYLYRLLFFGYSEARGLLPSNPNDKEYNKNSFEIICEEAKEILNTPGKINDIAEQYDFWDRIDGYLRIHVDEHYDGGLFENDDKSVLKNYKINNKYLVKAIAEINYFKNDKDEYVNKINYKDLSVRNLGSIYEGLLEYNLFIAEEMLVKRETSSKVKFVPASKTKVKKSDVKIKKGQVYISEDPTERKETGSYYTPEDVVEYIISNTVEKKVLDLKEEFIKEIEDDLYEVEVEVNETIKNGLQKQIDNKTLDFIENKVLDLNIVDSAMGSGHFLVNTSYKIANLIIEILSEYKWINEDLKLSVCYWRRRVVEECIYGIDINELAVYLSKLSLWLISATNDKPLSFIDHHLKVGNSIIGSKKNEIKLRMDKRSATLFDVDEVNSWETKILPKYKRINNLENDSMDDIKLKKQLYNQVNEEIDLLKKKFDYFLSSKLLKIEIKDEFNEIMLSNDLNRFYKDDIEPLIDYANKNNFFHWELEFPEVFHKGGFDLIIGNPPYFNIRRSNIVYKTDMYSRISTRTTNIASIFLYKMNDYMKQNTGILGYIIPKSFGHVKSWRKIRKFILKNRNLLNINDVGQAFKEVGLEAMIIILKNSTQNNSNVEVFNKYDLINKIEQDYFLKQNHIVSSLNEEKLSLVNKMKKRSIELGSIAKMPRGKYIKKKKLSDTPMKGYIQFLGGTNISQYKIKDGGKRKRNRFVKEDDSKLDSKREYFKENRIIYQNLMSSSPKFVACIDNKGLPTDDTVNNLILKTDKYYYKYILAVMNSKISSFYLKYYITNNSKLTVHLDEPYAGKCLIPDINKEKQKEICKLVNKISGIKEDKKTIKEIDQKLYNYFNLNKDEIHLNEKENLN